MAMVPERRMPVWEIGRPGDHLYFDRDRDPADTVARLWPHLSRLGITRLARQTGLDRIGIPCWASFRPNSKSLAGGQGKGLTDAAACASALMEAAEVAVAETPSGERRIATANLLEQGGERWFDPVRLLPFGTTFDTELELSWLSAADLQTGAPIWVPLDTVSMDGEQYELAGVCKSSNGLASGNTPEEALFHALCELIERDGTTIWSLLAPAGRASRVFDVRELADPVVDALCERVRNAGFEVQLIDQTSDIGIPVIMAMIGPRGDAPAGHLELAAGYGAHPVAARAAIRAITEAAQSRVTGIASSRDDITDAAFAGNAAADNARLFAARPVARAPTGLPVGSPLPLLLGASKAALAHAGIDALSIRVDGGDLPFAVVKVLAGALEDRDANLNWRPGARAIERLLAA